MTIQARRALSRTVQDFFATQLSGLYRFDQVRILPAEPAEKSPDQRVGRKQPYGKHAEKLVLQFGPAYRLAAISPNDHPPLGHVRLDWPGPGGVLQVLDGPLDQITWSRIGEFIRNRETQNGRRTG